MNLTHPNSPPPLTYRTPTWMLARLETCVQKIPFFSSKCSIFKSWETCHHLSLSKITNLTHPEHLHDLCTEKRHEPLKLPYSHSISPSLAWTDFILEGFECAPISADQVLAPGESGNVDCTQGSSLPYSFIDFRVWLPYPDWLFLLVQTMLTSLEKMSD